ncbi:MAG: hypothetical protein DMG35_16180 [Acidobacteria bacterium]|nr:MAG: hypothetical protein AUH86_18095 [Acidobacteria bacterium 13_1_40CM_4_58_4]PYT58870.1 MAG: hypothetical protein DMG35_16180 [Acidobacteriota bacterium]
MATTEEPAARGKLELLVRYREWREPQDGRKAFEALREVASRAGPGDGASDDYRSKFAAKRPNAESGRALRQILR